MSENTDQQPTEPTEAQEPARADEKTVDWEAEAKKWEKRSKDNYAKLKEAEPKLSEYQQIIDERKTVEERQAEEVTRWQTEAEQWRTAAVSNRITALASNDFADPSDAVAALAGQQFLDAGGQIDETAITAALSDVLERKPHWRRADPSSQQGPRPPAPNPNQGNTGAAASDPASLFGSIVRSQIGGG